MLAGFDHRRYLIPFRSQLLPHIFTDTLVIGSGVAGLRAAIESSRTGDVIVLAKAKVEISATSWAQGGIAGVRSPDDSIDAHVDDTHEAGAGLCDPQAVDVLVREGQEAIDELLHWGMRFDRDAGGGLNLGREGGHRFARILHTDGAATGRELARCLLARIRPLDNVRLFEECFALDLLTTGDDGRVLGVITFHSRYGLQIIWAKTTILASGGAGQVYRETTTPKTTTGDGLALAYRAGVDVGDLEFMQFHPTTLYVAGSARVLISEAVRGAGAKLVDADGERFMPEYHELADLAPRDVVSRAIVDRLARTGAEAVYLDARDLGAKGFSLRFPNLTRTLAAFDLDPETDLIPIHPSAHYTIGGVWADLDGRTSRPGLLACGEAAATGLHGANRLASNSLLEGLVFGRRAGRAAGAQTSGPLGPVNIVSDIPPPAHADLDLADVASSLRSAMWRHVGIERSGGALDDVMDMFGFWARYTMDRVFDRPEGWEIQNMLLAGALMTQAAKWREESRGVHRRIDHPSTDDAFRAHALWRRGVVNPALHPVAARAGAVG